MKRDLLINGYDAYAMGIAMGSGFIASLRAPASLKDFVENDDPKKDGKQVIYPEEPKVAARDLTLTFVIFGDTLTELQQFYRTTKKRQNGHQRTFNICGYLPLDLHR